MHSASMLSWQQPSCHMPQKPCFTQHYLQRSGSLQVAALKNLKLNIRRAKIKAGGGPIKFYITDALTSEKILKSARLEEIRLTIFNNLLKYHPESGAAIGWGEASTPVTDSIDPLHPLGARDGCASQILLYVTHVQKERYKLDANPCTPPTSYPRSRQWSCGLSLKTCCSFIVATSLRSRAPVT